MIDQFIDSHCFCLRNEGRGRIFEQVHSVVRNDGRSTRPHVGRANRLGKNQVLRGMQLGQELCEIIVHGAGHSSVRPPAHSLIGIRD